MIDPFALLDEPRRPWLDGESLKAKFLSLSANLHPDRIQSTSEQGKKAASDRFAELNVAYNRLLEPKSRLQALLELERGTPPAQMQSVGQEHIAFFSQVSELCRKADRFLGGLIKETSPLLKIRLLEANEELSTNLKELRDRVSRLIEALDDELKQLNPVWESAPPVGSAARANVLRCARLEEMYRDFGYLQRWSNQIQDRILRLSIHLNNLLQ